MRLIATMCALCVLGAIAGGPAMAAPIVTFYPISTSEDAGTHTATVTVGDHSDAIAILALADETGGNAPFTPTGVTFDGDTLGTQIGGSMETGNTYMNWGEVGDLTAGDVTLTFDDVPTDVAAGMWIIEDFLTSPSATAHAAWNDSGLSGGGPAGTFALNPSVAAPGTLYGGTSDELAWEEGDYVFAAMYNGNDTDRYEGLVGAFTEDGNQGQYSSSGCGVQFANGIAGSDSAEAGFESSDGWYRVQTVAVSFTPVPEPVTMSLLGLGFGAVVLRKRR
jgi:hypothetical protein